MLDVLTTADDADMGELVFKDRHLPPGSPNYCSAASGICTRLHHHSPGALTLEHLQIVYRHQAHTLCALKLQIPFMPKICTGIDSHQRGPTHPANVPCTTSRCLSGLSRMIHLQCSVV